MISTRPRSKGKCDTSCILYSTGTSLVYLWYMFVCKTVLPTLPPFLTRLQAKRESQVNVRHGHCRSGQTRQTEGRGGEMCTACRRAFGFSTERDREIRGIGMEGKVRCNRVCLASIVVRGAIPSLFDPGRYLRVGGIKSRHQPQDLCAQSPRFMPEGGKGSFAFASPSASRGMNGNEFWPREGKGSLLEVWYCMQCAVL